LIAVSTEQYQLNLTDIVITQGVWNIMENFGYLEMAIAQETNRQFQQLSHQQSQSPQSCSNSTCQNADDREVPPCQPHLPSAVPDDDNLPTNQVVGWWGLF
jgi:hypothetical protein